MVSKDIHEPQRAQETVSKHYKEYAKQSTLHECGWWLFNKVCFSPWQRSLFLLPAKYQRKEASASREQILQQTCVVESILH